MIGWPPPSSVPTERLLGQCRRLGTGPRGGGCTERAIPRGWAGGINPAKGDGQSSQEPRIWEEPRESGEGAGAQKLKGVQEGDRIKREAGCGTSEGSFLRDRVMNGP